MKNIIYKIICFFSVLMMLVSCAEIKPGVKEVVIDPVCSRNINKSESYVWEYSEKKYYFDSYECKESFKMNPKKFLDKKLVINCNITDPVCGMKVDLAESYDFTYSGRIYHFNSNTCRRAFKINPENFLIKNFAQKDSIKK